MHHAHPEIHHPEIHPPAPDAGRELARSRRLARYQRTTAVLERRADRSASAPLAAVLRERAAARRHVADRVRAHPDIHRPDGS